VELNPGPARPRRRGENISEEKRWEIVFYSKRFKLGPSAIARKLNVHRNSVIDILAKYSDTQSVHDLPGRGRKSILTASDIKKVIKKSGQRKMAPQIRLELKKKCSVRTIQRTLKKYGLFYGKIEKIQRLTKHHRQKRLEYATEMKDFNYETTVFSDEKTFQLGAGVKYCWQRIEHRETEEYVKHAPKLHVWAGIGSYVKTKLYLFEENLNSELYQKILKQSLKEKQLTYAPDSKRCIGKWKFLQDNSAVHKSRASMNTVEKLVGNRLITHPAMSPDLNPIEDMWSYLDRKVKASKVTNIRQLKRVLKKEWKNLDWSEIRKSVESMPRRLQQCLEREGSRTDY
jgi:hypothetical protein